MGETIKFDNKKVVNVKEENKSCKYFILTNDLFRGIGKSLLIVTQKRVRNFRSRWLISVEMNNYTWLIYIENQRVFYLLFLWVSTHTFKKESLKIPSIEVEQTTQLPKEKNTKGQTMIYKSYTYNWIASNTNPTKNRGWT